MRLKERVELVELAMARQRGDLNYKLVVRADGETDDETKRRAGLADWQGPVIFISEIEAKI